MTPEATALLKERHPSLFEGIHFECGDGWFNLLDVLAKGIDQRAPGVCRAVQVKEKFGGLRFYFSTYEDIDQRAADAIHGMVWMAESLSYHTCEECGVPGSRRPAGWIRTLCDTCDKGQKANG